jgi:hypothetical protein
MAEEGTAVLEAPVTDAPTEPAVEEATESPLEIAGPDLRVAETEEEPVEAETVTEPEPKPLSEADIQAAVDKAKESWEGERETERQAALSAYQKQQFEQASATAERERAGAAYQSIVDLANWVATQAENGEDWKAQFNPRVAETIAQRVAGMYRQGEWMENVSARSKAIEAAFPDYKASQGVIEDWVKAQTSYDRVGLMKAEIAAFTEAYESEILPKRLAAAIKESKTQDAAGDRLDAAATAQATNAANSPTRLSGGSPRSTRDEASAVLESLTSTSEQKRKAFEAKYGMPPNW